MAAELHVAREAQARGHSPVSQINVFVQQMWVRGDPLVSLLLLSLTKGGHDDEQQQRQQQRCKLYLAESSIPNAGLGIYFGDDIAENETLSHFQDVVLPILDIELHNDYNAIEWLISEYSWTASKLGVEVEAK